LAEVAHAHGAPLIVDGAWGPHFGFHPSLPESPARLGADLVISSTHKPAGSLTQSAMLHLGDGPSAEWPEPPIAPATTTSAPTSSSPAPTSSPGRSPNRRCSTSVRAPSPRCSNRS